MPCGGVRPCAIPPDHPAAHCLFCDRAGCGHFYEEFDAYVHARCFLRDLAQHPKGEAAIALRHGHQIYLDTTCDAEPKP